MKDSKRMYTKLHGVLALVGFAALGLSSTGCIAEAASEPSQQVGRSADRLVLSPSESTDPTPPGPRPATDLDIPVSAAKPTPGVRVDGAWGDRGPKLGPRPHPWRPPPSLDRPPTEPPRGTPVLVDPTGGDGTGPSVAP